MKLLESDYVNNLTGQMSLDFVDIFYFKNTALTEIHEGTVLTAEKMELMAVTILEFMGPGKHFHYVSNRVHSYNCVPTDLNKIPSLFENVESVNIVAYGDFGIQTIEFEKPFWPVNINIFKSLGEAYARVEKSAAA